jgi:NAD(P)-dependent dehydrogenase (short-subunit alcohol dehydrogenase family)
MALSLFLVYSHHTSERLLHDRRFMNSEKPKRATDQILQDDNGGVAMKKICVITGGGSGMGLEAAKILGTRYSLVLAGRTAKKLESAIQELSNLGIEAEAFPCDISKRPSVQELARFATEKGTVSIVIHAAGLSPKQGDAETVFIIDAMGTIYMNEEFSKVMGAGSCILDVSSMSAYMTPAEYLPIADYPLSLNDPEAFKGKMLALLQNLSKDQASGMAYVISKNFVIWYAKKCAVAYGKRGIRVLSISPGTFNTPMGEIEGDGAAAYALRGALGRVGEPVEIGRVMAFIVSPDSSYLTGTDILCDGGTIAALQQ